MRTSTRLRRTLAVTASAGLVSVLAMLPSGSAFALVSGSFETSGSANSSGTSGNTCTVVSGSSSSSSPTKAVVGGTVQTSTSLNATFQSSTDTNDLTTVTGHYTGVTKAAKSHGDLARLTMTGTGSVSVQRAEGSASHCRTTASIVSVIEPLNFTESHAGWFIATRTGTARSQIVELELENTTDSTGALVDVFEGGVSSATERAFGTAGTYGAIAAVGALSSGVLLKSANTTNLSLSFYRAGAAPRGVTGSGKKFVKFPGSVTCSSHSAKLTWSSKAGQVSSGAFFVNGSKKATDGHPVAGNHVVLKHLSATKDAKITAKLSLKGGGHASATRAYLPCKG